MKGSCTLSIMMSPARAREREKESERRRKKKRERKKETREKRSIELGNESMVVVVAEVVVDK
jgi:hypothetical protein